MIAFQREVPALYLSTVGSWVAFLLLLLEVGQLDCTNGGAEDMKADMMNLLLCC